MRLAKLEYSTCIGIEVLLASAIAVATAIGQQGLVSLLFALSFVVAFAYVGMDTVNRKKVNIGVYLVLLCFFCVLCNWLIKGNGISFDYVKKLIMFCAFVLLLYYATRPETVISATAARVLEYAPLLASVFLVVSYYFLGKTERRGAAITLGFSNPNFTGMWLLHCFLFVALFVIRAFCGASKWRLLAVPLLPILVSLISETEARGSIVGVIFFLVFLLLGGLFKRIPRAFSFFISLFPIAYALVYLELIDIEWFRETFAFLESEGKTLDSRVGIWQRSFEFFRASPLFGDYFGISGGTGQSQLHNTHIDVLCSYGLFALALFVKFLYDRLVSAFSKAKDLYGNASVFAFCAVIIAGSFEAAIVAGAMGLNLLSVALLVLPQLRNNKKIIGVL